MLGGQYIDNAGYTIIEIMIVLAVSGVMFLIAVTFIGGKQEQATFSSGVNSLATSLQNTLEQVQNGQYSDIPLNCTNSGSGINFPGGSFSQGTNSSCIFRGKFIHFYDSAVTSQETQYEVISMADSSSDDNTESNTINPSVTNIPGLSTQSVIPEGLYVYKVEAQLLNNPAEQDITNYANFGVLQSLGTANASGTGYQSGAQTLELAYSQSLTNTQPVTTAFNGGANMPIITSARVCITDGKKFSWVTIGGINNNALSVSVGSISEAACSG
jgi:prepilin-type N-terminal cleavage/methylation domain-containing protein